MCIRDSPVDVERGDQLLSLVTCSYTNDNGRLVVMLRALRDTETPDSIRSSIVSTTSAAA